MAYTTVTVEGGLFPPDLLDRIAAGDGGVEGQRPGDFGLDPSRRLIDETQAAFADARSFWDAFQRRLQRSRESATTLTREDWMVPFLELLGFDDLVVQRASAEAGGETFFISHRGGDDPDAPPVHIVAHDEGLDKRGSTGRRSPHAVVQEYLNRAGALWGLTTNGGRLRLLRDTTRFSKPTYLEFDIEGMVEGNLYSEFVLLYRLLHATRFPRDAAGAHECLLERYYQQGIDEGGRVRDKLRDGVQQALEVLGTAFLVHPDSQPLRDRIAAGGLDDQAYYRQLLRLVYRLLFLMVAEERKLVFPVAEDGQPASKEELERYAIYQKYYSVAHLRERCERYFAGDGYADLWQGLVTTFRLFRDDDLARKLGLRALNGELFGQFACKDIELAACANDQLLTAVRHLSTFIDDGSGRRKRRGVGPRRRVNYAALDVEEFGSVYESLLEYRPHVALDPPRFDLLAGSERKQTGSYYTPPELVRELINSALVPVMEERLAKAKTADDKIEALLSMKVCDPACGSGHFLLAAARRIARELAKVRDGEDEPTPAAQREATRDVIRNCIYAVDKNPLAVDLCKVALWIEGHSAGLPLSFLDHHVKCGDSLVGVFDLDVLEKGIPDEAYKPVTGDDKGAARGFRDRNKRERAGQVPAEGGGAAALPEFARLFAELASAPDATPEDVHSKEKRYQELQTRERLWQVRVAANLWTAAFFSKLEPDARVPTTAHVWNALANRSVDQAVDAAAEGIARHERFFHWPLEFPDVFARVGFDVVLGNPPWERIKLQEQEFFAGRDGAIAEAQNKAARDRLIKKLAEGNPALAAAFAKEKYAHEAASRFVRASGRFPLMAVGDVNTYALFAELDDALPNEYGRSGVIVPTGIATDDTTKEFFGGIASRNEIVSLYGFENEAFIFPGIHHATKFCLLTLAGPRSPHGPSDFVFFARDVEHLKEEERHFTLAAEDFLLLNPNTRTCPIFRWRRDANITKAIYRSVPILIEEGSPEGNPWGISFQRMFDMSNDSNLFRTREHLEAHGWRIDGNVFVNGGQRYLPLYEAKMIHHFDHRFGTYEGQTQAQSNQGKLPELTEEAHSDSRLAPLPLYWVPEAEVEARLADRCEREWLLGWRDITGAVVLRTVIATILPRTGVGNKIPLITVAEDNVGSIPILVGNLAAFVHDYAARQKLGGTTLNYFILKQLPVLPPDTYSASCPWCPRDLVGNWLSPHVLELTYTARDLRPFAQDLGWDGPPFRWDEERRFLLRCELDAAYFHLYGIQRDDVDYIMGTFPIVKRRDEERHGEYRTKRVMLDVYDAMAEAIRTGKPYQTLLDPPPADPRVAHSERKQVARG